MLTKLKRLGLALWSSWVGDALLVMIVIAALVVLHLVVPGTVPSGGDGGNWLALAAERIGEGVMSADVVYPPLFPTFVGWLQALVGDPIVAIVVAALTAKAVLVGAVYLCARPLGRLYAFVGALVVGTGGALLESYAWGGYPQLLAMGFALAATFLVVGYLNTGTPTHLVVGLVLCAATLSTHAMVGGLLGVALAIAVLHLLFMTDPRTAERRRSLRVGLGVAGVVLALSAIWLANSSVGGFEPTINPIGLSRVEAIVATVRDAPYPWAVVALAGLGVLFFRFWPDYVATTIAVGSSWSATSLALFFITGEPRALLVTQVGFVLLALLGFGALKEFLRPPNGSRIKDAQSRDIWHGLLLIAGAALSAALMVGGVIFYVSATDWYRVVDHEEIAGLDELDAVSQRDDLVVAARGHHGNPVGWWVEGYAQRPTYTAVDTSFLAFPEEIEQSELAMSVFGGELTPEEALSVLNELGARYVVVDKRGPDAQWLDTALAQTFGVIDASSSIVILRVPSEM